jgi:hypothetical protein
MSWVDLSIEVRWIWSLVWIVNVSDVVAIILVLWDHWLPHLPWQVIVVVLGWWLKASWVHWVNLSIEV